VCTGGQRLIGYFLYKLFVDQEKILLNENISISWRKAFNIYNFREAVFLGHWPDFFMTEQNYVHSIIMSENTDYWKLLWRVLILVWCKWPKCVSEKQGKKIVVEHSTVVLKRKAHLKLFHSFISAVCLHSWLKRPAFPFFVVEVSSISCICSSAMCDAK